MAKEVELNIEIDENGKIHVHPVGTQGEECLALMAFLEDIDGFVTEETLTNEDFECHNARSERLHG